MISEIVYYIYYSILGLFTYSSSINVKQKQKKEELSFEEIKIRINNTKELIEEYKSKSSHKSIQNIYDILLKKYDFPSDNLKNDEYILKWFDKQILIFNDEQNIREKMKILLLKIEYLSWSKIERMGRDIQLYKIYLADMVVYENDIIKENIVYVMNE
jgi:hypothetical protein